MKFLNEDEIVLDMDELEILMTNKCNYCEFAPGRCSEQGGCVKGIREWINKTKAELTKK